MPARAQAAGSLGPFTPRTLGPTILQPLLRVLLTHLLAWPHNSQPLCPSRPGRPCGPWSTSLLCPTGSDRCLQAVTAGRGPGW